MERFGKLPGMPSGAWSLDLVQPGTRRWRPMFRDGQPGNRELGGGADFSGARWGRSFGGHADQAGAGSPKTGPQITMISNKGETKERCSTRELFYVLTQSFDSKAAMDLIMIYTITFSVALLLFYPVVNCMRYITWRLTQHYPKAASCFALFLQLIASFLPLTSCHCCCSSLVPGTALFVRNVQYPLILPRRVLDERQYRLECVILLPYILRPTVPSSSWREQTSERWPRCWLSTTRHHCSSGPH